jgi:MIP family channel proteins
MRDALRHGLAEFIGTFALVFIGSGAIIASKLPDSTLGLTSIAIAHGLVLAIFVTALMRISGHFNPAVTAGFIVTRRITGPMAGIYIAAQILGAVIAAYALKGLFPDAAYIAARGGGQGVATSVTTVQALVIEAIATFFLVFVVFATAVDEKAPKVGGFAIGLTICADILAVGPLTGASMNPARSFGPALVSGIFEAQMIYWVGPLIGGIVAALIYDRLYLRSPTEPPDHGAVKART